MGVYETLFRFADATDKYMGDPGTHPWAQGYPITTQLPDGPPLPDTVTLTARDRMYPKATGEIELRTAIADYYNSFYDAGITPDHVAVFAGGRPAIFAILAFLLEDIAIAIEETEYTPYYDVLKILDKQVELIPSNPGNRFRPTPADRDVAPRFLVKSNPCNPTGVTVRGDDLKALVQHWSADGRGALIDEAYEFFGDPEPESALRYIDDIDKTNLFIVGAATKGLQVPGLRVGWCIAKPEHIRIFRNYSSWGMGGVSRASQLYVTELLEHDRVRRARDAVVAYFGGHRKRYGEGLANLGIELFTGTGGFYHWGQLQGGLTGDEFNERLFKHEAAILPGRLCDMARRGAEGPLGDVIRFSFGPLGPDSYDEDMRILAACL
jgi:aspartate/methionine/tyrosine aminotransferase